MGMNNVEGSDINVNKVWMFPAVSWLYTWLWMTGAS
jgi:hypothetical protein